MSPHLEPSLPEPIAKLEGFLAASAITHETIFDLRGSLVAAGVGVPSALMRDAARIAADQVPALLSAARKLAARWEDESVLDASRADATLRELAGELTAVEPAFRALRVRQDTIARELAELLGRSRE